jgi:hypothetical protein
MFKNSETTKGLVVVVVVVVLEWRGYGCIDAHAHRRIKFVLLKIASYFITLGYVFFNYCLKVPKNLLLLLPYFECRIFETGSKLYHQIMKCNEHIYLPI